MKPSRVVALAGVVICGLVTVILTRREPDLSQLSAPGLNPGRNRTSQVLRPAVTRPPVTEPTENSVLLSETASSATEQSDVLGMSGRAPSLARISVGNVKKGKDPIKDQLAREALAWVGYDEAAEAYWVAAINDPNLAAQERQDLIEDLNEDGISDPKHPTLADLPLILNRLDLVEALAPDAMDEVNADAFLEAYKDLVNLAFVAVGAGEPVR